MSGPTLTTCAVDLVAAARATGLRGFLHGVPPDLARQLLRDFVDEVAAQQTVAGFPPLDSPVVDEATWSFIMALPHELPGPVFNDLKPAIHAALKAYITCRQPLSAHAKAEAMRVAKQLPETPREDLDEASRAYVARIIVALVQQFDLAEHLVRQRAFSLATFGPAYSAAALCDHIGKELVEIRESNGDLSEWVDVIILALDGALRSGAGPQKVIEAIVAKQTKNEGRTWPDWRTAPADKAIEHDRSEDL